MDIIQPSEIDESWKKTCRDPVNNQTPFRNLPSKLILIRPHLNVFYSDEPFCNIRPTTLFAALAQYFLHDAVVEVQKLRTDHHLPTLLPVNFRDL